MSILLPDDDTGPSLAQCSFDIDDITFKRVLGSDEYDETNGTSPHSRVFKIELKSNKGKHYALKIFKFAAIEDLRPWIGRNPRLERLLTDKYIRHHEDPFFRECRAFAKLNLADKKKIRVVYCHGWLYLDAAMEARIGREFQIHEWDRLPEHKNQPLRALVKDWLSFHTPFNRRKFNAMRLDLLYLNHQEYIFNLDIRKGNYVGGWLFDFSSSRTDPHILFQEGVRTKERNDMDIHCDIAFFDTMVEDYKTEHRAEQDEEEKIRTKEMEERRKTLRSYQTRLAQETSGAKRKTLRRGQKTAPRVLRTASAKIPKRKQVRRK